MKKTILSAIKPTGRLTLGSYIGAIKNWLNFQDEYNCFFCIADLHALTIRNDPSLLKKRTLEQFAAYIACGLRYDENALFLQSHTPAHAELAWVLNCYTMFGELSRMTQFKDKSAKNEGNINAGLFTYPALMAADILLYQADLVPVGHDQLQHVEICRDIANRFNSTYGDVFKVPEPFIPKIGARIMSLTEPQNKMSKSDDDPHGSVYLLDSNDEIMRKFKRAVTDSDTRICYDTENKPGISNLITIYSFCTGKAYYEIEDEFLNKGYGAFKSAVGEAVCFIVDPIRKKTNELLTDKAQLEQIYKEGAEKAQYTSKKTLLKVYKKVGLIV